MKKITLISSIAMFLVTLTVISCRKHEEEEATKSCNYKLDIAYKWYNTYTTLETYSDNTRAKKISTKVISTVGFLKVDPSGTYEIVNNDIAQVGSWKLDENTCQLTLSDKSIKSIIVQYDILSLATGNLIIKRIDGNMVYTEHYKTADCSTVAQLTKQWDNNKIYYFDYYSSTNTFINPYLVYPVGYFKLNTDLTYNVVSDGVPLNGTWKLGQPYCMIDLDVAKYNARSFEIVKITSDSLVIWRKDPTVGRAYLQYYLKH
ncbi:hypothetical protein [Pedobacter sp.]|uniref:hypothetical protein n=1 Tax=Pedobacter sp. TaxID=1411316 RepID=UPI003BACD929